VRENGKLRSLEGASERLLSALSRLRRFCEGEEGGARSLFGIQQECLVVDRAVFSLRPDLMLTGRTLVGKSHFEEPVGGHFLAAPRVKDFLGEVKRTADLLGLRLEKVDSSGDVFACRWESCLGKALEASRCFDQLREIAVDAAAERGLICLFHEKPFKSVKGSLISLRWELQTDAGRNLLDPTEDLFSFSILTAAFLRAMHRHAPLIWACIGSLGNDLHFPDEMMDVHLGKEARARLVAGGVLSELAAKESAYLASVERDHFVFSGAPFLRAPSLLMATLELALAQSLDVLLDALESKIEDTKTAQEKWRQMAAILTEGFQKEFFLKTKRKKSPEVYKAFLEPAASQIFEEIFTGKELEDLFNVHVESYSIALEKEADVLIDLFRTQILPASLSAQEVLASSLKVVLEVCLSPSPRLTDELSELSRLISEALGRADELERVLKQARDLSGFAKAKVLSELIGPKMELVRESVDALEQIVDGALWPIPKYRELLYSALFHEAPK